MKPDFSFIIPIYAVEDCLDRCVQSVMKQTYRNIEIILVDDGSPDGCPAMCGMYEKQDSRIRVIHQENRGHTPGKATTSLSATVGPRVRNCAWLMILKVNHVPDKPS